MTTYTNIPILAPGAFTAMDGLPVRFREADLLAVEADLAARQASAATDALVPLNLEHSAMPPVAATILSPSESAARLPPPLDSLGSASNIRYDPLRRHLLADLAVRDDALNAAIASGQYQSRSAELQLDDSLRLTGLALLEHLSPAVPGLGALGRGGVMPRSPEGDAWRRPSKITRDANNPTHNISLYGGSV